MMKLFQSRGHGQDFRDGILRSGEMKLARGIH